MWTNSVNLEFFSKQEWPHCECPMPNISSLVTNWTIHSTCTYKNIKGNTKLGRTIKWQKLWKKEITVKLLNSDRCMRTTWIVWQWDATKCFWMSSLFWFEVDEQLLILSSDHPKMNVCLTGCKCNRVLLNVSPFWFEADEQLLLSSNHPKKNVYQVVYRGQAILRTRSFRK